VIAPPEFVTLQQGLRLDINHRTLKIDQWFAVGRDASQALLDRLAARESELRARVEGVGGRVLPGPGESSGASAATADMGVARAFQLLRACISMFAQGRDGSKVAWERFKPGDPSALRLLALRIMDARRTVAVLRSSPQPLAGGWVDSLCSSRDRLDELNEASSGPDGAGAEGADKSRGASVGRRPFPRTGGRSASATASWSRSALSVLSAPSSSPPSPE